LGHFACQEVSREKQSRQAAGEICLLGAIFSDKIKFRPESPVKLPVFTSKPNPKTCLL
jgi:hypothetical protein